MAHKAAMQGRDHAPKGSDPTPAVYHIKVFSDTQTVTTGDGKFIFAFPYVSGTLKDLEIDVTTVSSSGIVQVQVRNATQSLDMLSTRIQVDASEFHSKDASTLFVINSANAVIERGDRIAVDVDAAGTGAKGMGISLIFNIP